VNELRGAIGDFTMKVIAEGVVAVTDNKFTLSPERLCFYIDDTYDFIDDPYYPSQPLGFWNFNGLALSVAKAELSNIGVADELQGLATRSMLIKGSELDQQYADIAAQRYFLIKNKNFKAYRDQYYKGGDFKIFSDFHYEAVSVEDVVLDR
jgi:hypothetical protein